MTRRSRGIAIASATSQGLVALGTLLAARACDPAFFGVLGVFTTLVVIGGTLASLRLEAAIVLPRRDGDAHRLAMLGFAVSPLVAAVGWLTITRVGPEVLPHFDADDLLPAAWAVPAGILVHGWRAIALGWCTRKGLVRAVAQGRLANGIAMSAGLVYAAVASPTLTALIVAWLAGQAAELVILGAWTIGDPGFASARNRPRRRNRLWRRYRRFPTVQMWSFLIEQLGPHLPTALIAGAFSAEVAGVYSVISRIIGRPMAVIGSSIAVVFQHEASVGRRNRRPLRPVMATALRRLGIFAVVIFIPIAVIGPWVLPRLLGSNWIDPGLALLVVLPGVAADFVALPILPILGIVERVGTQLAGAVARLVLVAGAIIGLGLAGTSPIVMMGVVAVVILGVNLIMLAIAWRDTGGTTTRTPEESF